MVGFRLLMVIAVVVVCMHFVLGAPAEQESQDIDMSRKFVDFLKEQREFHGMLDTPRFAVNDIFRRKRQAMNGMDIDNEADPDQKSKEPGFFDRAAKFVMEVLQRFLKWVNSSSD